MFFDVNCELTSLTSKNLYNYVMHAVYCKFTLYFNYKSWLLS